MTSFVRKELRELTRRPGAVFGLMLGPLAIMALFGVGYNGTRPTLQAIIVTPPNTGLPTDRSYYQDIVGDRAQVIDVTSDIDTARQRIAGTADLLVALPPDFEAHAQRGEQSVITVVWNAVDPIQDGIDQTAAQYVVDRLNKEVIKRAAAAAQQSGTPPLSNIRPEVVAEPARLVSHNDAPIEPKVLWFFAPAVLALVLQHVAVTLTALSLVRERVSGAMELFRVSPITSLEVLLGKYLAYSLFALVLTAFVSLALVMLAGVPILGGWSMLILAIAPFVFASLGLGLLLSLLADSERQAVQLSLLVLLASVFFGGLVIPVIALKEPVQELSYVLPVTHATLLAQDVMLRGALSPLTSLFWLLGLGGAFFVAAALALSRAMRAR